MLRPARAKPGLRAGRGSPIPRRAGTVLGFLLGAGLLAACTPGSTSSPSPRPSTLRVLASNEVTDLGPVLKQAARDTGVSVRMTPTDSLTGSRLVADGQASGRYDAALLDSGRYLAMIPGASAKLDATTPVMSSPVVVGVRASVARRLGWGRRPVSWSGIAAAAGEHRFTFGMADPGRSNAGLSALVGVATAAAGNGSPLRPGQLPDASPVLRKLLSGQALKEPTAAGLTGAYVRDQAAGAQGSPVDGLITYESSLLSLNASGKLREPLTVIYPSDGVATADYSLDLLSSAPSAAGDAYHRLASYLARPSVQRAIMRSTGRRPVDPGVALDPRFGRRLTFELPFPESAEVVNDLLSAYAGTLRRPARTVYVLDTSSSMAARHRLSSLKAAIDRLASSNAAFATPGTALQPREQVTFVPFSTAPAATKTFTLPPGGSGTALRAIRAYVSGLSAGGQTAIYDALARAYRFITRQAAADPYRITSVVLLSDGVSNTGRDLAQFTALYRGLPRAARSVPVYPVLFGQSADTQMRRLARLTGGRVFDGRNQPLTSVFAQIRGSQ